MTAIAASDSSRIVELKKEFYALSREHADLQTTIAPEQISAAVTRIAEITQRKLVIATEVFEQGNLDSEKLKAEKIARDLAHEYQT